jgi:hypothetical protein
MKLEETEYYQIMNIRKFLFIFLILLKFKKISTSKQFFVCHST